MGPFRKQLVEEVKRLKDEVLDFLSSGDAEETSESTLQSTLDELRLLTTDEDDEVIKLRGLKIYLAMVKHAQNGGTIKLISTDSKIRTLKLRTR